MAGPLDPVNPIPTAPAATPPGEVTPPPAAAPAEPPRTYTAEEHKAALVGQGKELKRLQEENEALAAAAAERKTADEAAETARLEAAGEHQKLREQAEARATALEEENNALKERETTRLEAKDKANEKRIKELPKEYRDLIPAGLGPDAKEEQIAKLERISGTAVPVGVHQGVPRNAPALTDEEARKKHNEDLQKAGWDAMTGKKPEEAAS